MTTYGSSNKGARVTERKVLAGASGAGAGVLLANVVLYFVDAVLWTPETVGDIPGWLVTPVETMAALVVAYALAWAAKHTYRPDLPAPAPETA